MTNKSISDLFAAYENGGLARSSFDHELWLILIRLAGDRAEHLNTMPVPVRNYVASRYMEWEVNNGTFSQAAYSIPEWFEPAAVGYEAFGLHAAAALIRKAHQILCSGASTFTREPSMKIEDVFKEFELSPLYKLDWLEPDIGWDAEEKRVQYVLRNAEAFKGVA